MLYILNPGFELDQGLISTVLLYNNKKEENMFSLFKAKAGSHDMDTDDMSMSVPVPLVKIGGHEFMPGDSKSIQQFDSWSAKAQSSDTFIQVDNGTPDGTWVPVNSVLGKAELAKADLQLRHGMSQTTASKVINQVPEVKAAINATSSAVKAKGTISDQAPPSEPVALKGSATQATAKAGGFRGNKGPIR